MLFIIYFALSLLIVGISQWIYKWRNPKCNGLLPPGSMGLPFIGETLHLLAPGSSFDLIPFMKSRIRRYGPIFRTNIACRSIIVSADSKFNNFIIQQDGKLFETWYLDTFAKLFIQEGEKSINISSVHKYVRSTALKHFSTDALRDKLLPQMVDLVHETLCDWSIHDCINLKHASAKMALQFGAKQLFSFDAQQSEKLLDLYYSLTQGLLSIPLNIPGSAYNKCFKNRKKAMDIIRDVLKKKQQGGSAETCKGDFLDYVIKDMNDVKFLTEDFVVELFFALVYVTFDSLSTTLTVMLKLIEEHPMVLEELVAEHEAILKKRENMNSSFTWDEYKSVTFTRYVINESLRLANITPGLFRRALVDVQVNGYIIPAGWGIMLATSAMHLDSETFQDPLEFNPWRWQEANNDMMKSLMPFGGGMKQCAGAEYARVLMSTFLHVLLTKYRWKRIKGGEIYRNPIINFGEGLHIKIMNK